MAHQIERLRPLWLGSFLYLVCFILSLIQFEVPVLAKVSDYYTAAVFEHVPYDGGKKFTPPQKEIQKNLRRYSVAARTAAKQKSDIIVFPEWGLYNSENGNRSTLLQYAEDVPDPSYHYWNPCKNHSLFKDRPILQHLSCLAKDNGLFLVANIADVKNCTPEDNGGATSSSEEGSTKCPPDGRKFFNTNVVFNREGTLVTRYYKIHLYYEPEFSVPANPELAFFETDFGLFTTFTCFDISYREAVDAVETNDVLNVAFPTYWFDTLPFMSAIQFHQAFALTNRINVLAANVHYPGWGTIGSGIYSGTKGALVYTFNPDGKAKLMVSRVPIVKDQDFHTRAKIFRIGDRRAKDITNKKQDSKVPKQCSTKILGPPKDYKDYRCEEMNTTAYSFKKLVQSTGYLEVCQNGLCCNLSYTADSMKEDFYLGAFNGIDIVDDTFGFCEENCILIRCDKGGRSNSCNTYPLITSTRFRNFKLSGTFTTKYVYPSLLKSKMRLSSTDDWNFLNGNGRAQIIYEPKSKRGDLIRVAGLYGRCYDRDP